MKPTSMITSKLKLKKQKKVTLTNGKVKKGKKLQPQQKVALKLKEKKKKRPPASHNHEACNNNAVTTIRATNYVKNPLKHLLKECNFKTVHGSRSTLNFTNLKPKIDEKQCSVHVIDYAVPMPEVEDFDDDISELDSLDLALEVETASEDDTLTEPNFIEQKVGEFQRYHIPTGAIILLYKDSTIFMHGFMRLNVLHGTVDVHGKHIDKMHLPSMVYSPKGSAFLSLKNMNVVGKTEENTRKLLKKQLIMLGINSGVAEDIVQYKLKVSTAVLHCENVMDKATEFLELNLVQKIYPKVHNGLRCSFRNVTSKEWNVLEVNPEWTPLANTLMFKLDEKTDGATKKVMLCGGKGVGKSTLLRFLVNKMLNTRDEVFVLDLDPGQPEFTVPGAISLVKVTASLLGPNYTHLQNTMKTVFVPNINISADHESYMQSVQQLVDSLASEFALTLNGAQLLVNYMGFTKGLGVLVTAKVLSLLQADVVVQIVSQNESKNFNVDLTPEAMRQVLNESDSSKKMNEFKLLKVDSVAKNLENVGWQLEPRQVREMCILSYFSRLLPGSCKFFTEKDVPIYKTSLNDVKVLFNGKECDPSAANANIVALCVEDRICLGWGIVRGVCRQSNSLLMLTPLDSEQLEHVESVIVGSVTLPPAIYLRHHDSIRGLVPYTFKGALSNFARTPKRNIVPKR